MAELKRDIGLIGLTFISVGGIIGSGWLFGPLLAVQHAGPAAILSWLIGAAAMFILAITFAEISAMLPIPGGIARVPQFSHGNIVSMAMGWTAWIGYNTTAPIEVEAMLKYLAPYAPWLHAADTGDLTGAGVFVALVFMLLFVAVNALGVKFFTHVNAALTWAKIAIPVVLSALLIASRFNAENFTQPDGFAPYGSQGIMAAVSTGGVIFSFIGFRHVVDMAGEVRNPKFAIPAALVLSIIMCAAIYLGLQVAFIGALDPSLLTNGWAQLNFGGEGPLDAVIMSVGLVWFISLLNVGSVVGPFGNGLVATGSNARIALALSQNGFLPKRLQNLSSFGVPVWALALNFLIGTLFLLTVPFTTVIALNGAAIVLSFAVGPIAVVCLRDLLPDQPRSIRIPAVRLVALTAFAIATLIVYWSGWDTVWRLGIALIVGKILLLIRFRGRLDEMDLTEAVWLMPYFAGLGLISFLGQFGTGALKQIPFGWDILLCVVFSAIIFALAIRSALSDEKFMKYIAEEEILDPKQPVIGL
ncbi:MULTISPECIES: APC family permease [unclassified Ruegeria]|nr:MULTISPECIES: APC family permease [unclassified Ruegeria]NOD75278.1 amino acid permease [Ruegeria sp. HKCCD4332]NOD87239.1 amino acid permease [Ruegeria sp. HKCCD4318]NOE12794.1 amino acid permease [Ruegeria sp. HKCCD4318-2]NOG09040.1 APC family permease [Ruegeria sp. HKCCD4315]